MATVEELAAFLEKTHLFRDLKEEHLFGFAEHLSEEKFDVGETILAKEEQSLDFYLIWSGKVEVIKEGKGQKKAIFVSGDYLGEESLISSRHRTSFVKAKSEVVLLKLPASSFDELADAVDILKKRLTVSVAGRQLSKKIHFDWVNEDEVIYFLVRKHPILFIRRLVLPFLFGSAGLATLASGMWNGVMLLVLLGGFGLLAALALVVWDWVDWRNDYYIVTNQRVIWLEKVVGLYDSRQEAYLAEVLSVDAKADAVVQTFMDYGIVSVRTMVGSIDLNYIRYPQQARYIIEELWFRSQEKEKIDEKKSLKKAIMESLEDPNPLEKKKKKEPPPKKSFWEQLFPQKESHLFNLRFEEGKEIIYRKHIVILLRRAGIPFLIFLGIFVFFFYQLYLFFLLRSDQALPFSFIMLLFIGSILALGWTLYQYVDWSNDIFKVSKEKIFDIDRKPLGEVQSRSAPLENIESTEYQRTGIMSVLFNYGTVYIYIGAEHFEFENVSDPAAVQQDINKRYLAQHEKKKEEEAKKERTEMLKWLIAYHESEDEFNKMMAKKKDKNGEEKDF